MRSALTPASPPKKLTKINDEAATNSPMPSEIIANTVPALCVEKLPTKTAAISPISPPTSGIRVMEKYTVSNSIMISAWTAINPPRPKYTAWPNESIPP